MGAEHNRMPPAYYRDATAMLAGDPHRKACRWNGQTDQSSAPWPSLVDWAVYHAPGWEAWQRFRISLIGTSYSQRIAMLREWLQDSAVGPERSSGCWDIPLADVARVVNVLRSLRGQFSAHPQLRAFLTEVTPLLHRRWEGCTSQGRLP